MKTFRQIARFLLLVIPILLVFHFCEDPNKPESTPPSITIQSPVDGQTVGGIVRIVAEVDDNEGITLVEFFINDVSLIADASAPFEIDWNTTDYEDGQHTIGATASDESDNSTDAKSVLVTVDNYDAIIFISKRDGSTEIYKMQSDGSLQRNLTKDGGNGVWVRFFPSGDKILFSRPRDGFFDLYTMDIDGSNLLRVTTVGMNTGGLANISPDDSKIIFSSSVTGDYEVYIVNADGSNLTRLTYNVGTDASAYFSLDGTRIIYISAVVGKRQIFSMNLDGGDQVQLTFDDNDHVTYERGFTHDGQRIIYHSYNDTTRWISVMDMDGGNQTILTKLNLPYFLDITSDDSKILFREVPGTGVAALYLMNIDGTGRIMLTNSNDLSGSFSSDDQEILFISERDGNTQIYRMFINGSNQVNLSNSSTSHDFSPQYRPR